MNKAVFDSGPIYVETLNPGLWLYEPWNTLSNLLFAAIIIYWLFKTRFNFKHFPLILSALPILLVGFIGGSVYHATRSANIWLYLDFIPIILLSFIAAVHFWKLLLGRLSSAIIIAALFVFLPRIIISQLNLPFYVFVAVSYSALATMILLPAYLYSSKNNFVGIKQLNFAVIAFIFAISFRTLDRQLDFILPMGSHFLWHIFGATSAHCLLYFIYQLNFSVNNSINSAAK